MLIVAMIYMVAHMDTVGEMLLDILFQQFHFELVLDKEIDTVKRSFYKARGATTRLYQMQQPGNTPMPRQQQTTYGRERSNSIEKIGGSKPKVNVTAAPGPKIVPSLNIQ